MPIKATEGRKLLSANITGNHHIYITTGQLLIFMALSDAGEDPTNDHNNGKLEYK
jgi:hypothetical protein